jgi:hypothetical protein
MFLLLFFLFFVSFTLFFTVKFGLERHRAIRYTELNFAFNLFVYFHSKSGLGLYFASRDEFSTTTITSYPTHPAARMTGLPFFLLP